MTNSKRQQYGLGSFVKKFTRPIKKVLKSPIGKAALLGGLGWAANAGKIPGLGSGWMSNLSNPFGAAKKNWLRNLFLAKGEDIGGRLSGGKLGLGGLGLLAVGTPLWQKMMKTGPYEEIEEETGDWTIPSPNLANLLTRTKDYYRNYNPSLSDLSFQPAKQFVDPTFYSAKGGRAGHQRGGPAGGASAGGDYGGNVNPQQEYAGRTFQDTYRGGDNITGGNTITVDNTIRSGDMLPPPNLTPPSTVDRHRKLLTQNLYHKGDDEFDDQTVDYLGNKVDQTWMDSIQSGVGKNPHLSVDQLAQIADDATMNRFSQDSLENQAEKAWMGSIQSGLGKNPHLSVDQLAEIADDATMHDFSGMEGDVAFTRDSKKDKRLRTLHNQVTEGLFMNDADKQEYQDLLKEDKEQTTEPKTYFSARGGIARLANGGGVAEAQAEQMLKMEYQKYRNQGGTMSYQQFKMQVLQQAQGQGPMAQGQPRMAQPQMAAKGGRIGKDEGGLMDMGGMEKDYRQEGGFVPIGGKEKADDVPARLSKNEFVFTADAVRNAGGGDIDQGAEVMENVMKNLEEGGEISEESQGAQGMYNNMKQLETRIA